MPIATREIATETTPTVRGIDSALLLSFRLIRTPGAPIWSDSRDNAHLLSNASRFSCSNKRNSSAVVIVTGNEVFIAILAMASPRSDVVRQPQLQPQILGGAAVMLVVVRSRMQEHSVETAPRAPLHRPCLRIQANALASC